MNKLDTQKRVQILSMLCEGSSMRSVSRICDVSINTVAKLLVDAGEACAVFHDETVRAVQSKRVQADEIWSFCYAKQKNVPSAKAAPESSGDVWTFTAIDADSKLILSWLVGSRDGDTAYQFMDDLRGRLANRVQMTTDAFRGYLEAVGGTFGPDNIDYGMLTKHYGSSPDAERRYSPPVCLGTSQKEIFGAPDAKHISTSYVERQNLTMRMSMRRFTRLTNAFSKKFENHCHALALYFYWYNWVRTHKAHKLSPAMAAGLTDKLMNWSDMIAIIDQREEDRRSNAIKARFEMQMSALRKVSY